MEEIIPLRQDVIIRGTDRSTPYFDGDHDETTKHYGAFSGDAIFCCLSMYHVDFEDQPAFQLRGMATHPDARGVGLGRELIRYVEETLSAETGITLFWCNARTSAVGFYKKQGWQTIADEFNIPGVGPHYKMKKIYRSNLMARK